MFFCQTEIAWYVYKETLSRPAAVGDLWNVGEVNIIGICRDVNGVEVDRPKEGQQASLSQPLIGDEKNCKCCMFFTCWDEMYNNKLVNLITNCYYAPYFLRQKYSLNNRKYKSKIQCGWEKIYKKVSLWQFTTKIHKSVFVIRSVCI